MSWQRNFRIATSEHCPERPCGGNDNRGMPLEQRIELRLARH